MERFQCFFFRAIFAGDPYTFVANLDVAVIEPKHEHLLLDLCQLAQARQAVEVIIALPEVVKIDTIAHLQVFASVARPRDRIS